MSRLLWELKLFAEAFCFNNFPQILLDRFHIAFSVPSFAQATRVVRHTLSFGESGLFPSRLFNGFYGLSVWSFSWVSWRYWKFITLSLILSGLVKKANHELDLFSSQKQNRIFLPCHHDSAYQCATYNQGKVQFLKKHDNSLIEAFQDHSKKTRLGKS